MANTEGPEGRPDQDAPPLAWVWSQYRGEAPDAPEFYTPGSPAKNSVLTAIGLAAAIVVVAGLTWLFTTKPAADPARGSTPQTESAQPAPIEAAPASQKSEGAPAPVAESVKAAPAAAPVHETPKAAAATKKKRKHAH